MIVATDSATANDNSSKSSVSNYRLFDRHKQIHKGVLLTLTRMGWLAGWLVGWLAGWLTGWQNVHIFNFCCSVDFHEMQTAVVVVRIKQMSPYIRHIYHDFWFHFVMPRKESLSLKSCSEH
uniref:Uncharacterized protein n=1 Tax=Glossina pallidipes TaxID=7398 RepID=A0A1A9ZWP6_GLOPL